MSEEGNKPGPEAQENETQEKPGFWAITISVIAAAFGVQTDKNRQRDFSQGNPLAYIVGGLVFTVLFVLSIVGIVMLVLP